MPTEHQDGMACDLDDAGEVDELEDWFDPPERGVICADRDEAMAVAAYWVRGSLVKDERCSLSRSDHLYVVMARDRLWRMIQARLLRHSDLRELAEQPEHLSRGRRDRIEAEWIRIEPWACETPCHRPLREFDVRGLWAAPPPPPADGEDACAECRERRRQVEHVEGHVLARLHEDRRQSAEELRDVYGTSSAEVDEAAERAAARLSDLVAQGHVTASQLGVARVQRLRRSPLLI